MRERPLLYFALGVLLTTSIGAVSLREDGIELPDGSVLTSADTRRAFYLTDLTFLGSQAKSVCDNVGFDGTSTFHMASLWEIRDVTQLRYATSDELSIGFALTEAEDGGPGPPADTGFERGWIRNGVGPFGLASQDWPAGLTNCADWTKSQSDYEGTVVSLTICWDPLSCTDPQGIGVWGGGWSASNASCNEPQRVWCVED